MRYVSGLLYAAALWADWNNTSSGIELAKLPHPKLTKVHAGEVATGQTVVFDEITVTRAESATLLRGKGKSGKTWTVSMCGRCLQEVWRGDLDADGTVDYAIVGEGPYDTGRSTPLHSISLLLMDADGMPMPFIAPVYKDDGINSFIQVEGKVRLLISRYDEIPSDSGVGPFCSGHWVTQVYGFVNLFVKEVRGVVAGIRFPFVRNWAYSHPECVHNPIGFSDRPKILEIGTVTKGGAGDCAPLLVEAMVFDSGASREVAFFGETQAKLADKIRLADAGVELRGVHDCTAGLMWARSTK